MLLGKFQVECSEERFGKYRQLSGAHYHVSISARVQDKTCLQKIPELPDTEAAAEAVAAVSGAFG